MELKLEELPKDVGTLQRLVMDLSRRLQNANHTIDAQQHRILHSSQMAEMYRLQLHDVSSALRLETSKCSQLQRSKVKSEEAERFEIDKKKSTRLQEEIRLTIIDQAIKGINRDTNKIIRMRNQLEVLENRKESQQKVLHQLKEVDDTIELLALSAQNGDLYTCHQLVMQGISVNELDAAGYLPLHYACSGGHRDIVQLLLEFGADCTSYISSSSPVEVAASNGNADIVKLLVDFGASIEDHSPGGSPPLVAAAASGHLECVEDLLALGASVSSVDSCDNTALHLAAQRTSDPAPMIKLLMSHGADLKALNNKGLTPLHLALNLMNIPAIEALGGREDFTAGLDRADGLAGTTGTGGGGGGVGAAGASGRLKDSRMSQSGKMSGRLPPTGSRRPGATGSTNVSTKDNTAAITTTATTTTGTGTGTGTGTATSAAGELTGAGNLNTTTTSATAAASDRQKGSNVNMKKKIPMTNRNSVNSVSNSEEGSTDGRDDGNAADDRSAASSITFDPA